MLHRAVRVLTLPRPVKLPLVSCQARLASSLSALSVDNIHGFGIHTRGRLPPRVRSTRITNKSFGMFAMGLPTNYGVWGLIKNGRWDLRLKLARRRTMKVNVLRAPTWNLAQTLNSHVR